MMRVCTVVGARPQFVKASVVSRALAQAGIAERLIHTGQHYDRQLSRVFFEELEIPEPSLNLGVGSGPHGEQTGAIMVRLEEALLAEPLPDWLLVYGDTNSTLAAALVAAKLHVPIVHVEAGLRSFNRAMPEEVNRVLTDHAADLLCCPSRAAAAHLAAEGITEGVHVTGDVMYDVLLHLRDRAVARRPLDALGIESMDDYLLLTLHRAENTDDPERLADLMRLVESLAAPVVWPMHPRTRVRLEQFELPVPERVHVIEPVGYLDMLALLDGAQAVLTDSGGLQKEAYWTATPCLTLRAETEWTETLEDGWNKLVGADVERARAALADPPHGAPKPHYGTGDAAGRIVRLLTDPTA